MARRFSAQDATGILLDNGLNFGLLVQLSSVPADGTKGFATGCYLVITGSPTAGAQVYINEGTTASCAFKALPSWAPANALVASGASLTITSAHHGKTIVCAAAAAITLPAASGSGIFVTFAMPQDATNVTITATGAFIFGTLPINTDSAFQAGTLFATGGAVSTAGSTVITLDGTTRGGRKGDWISMQDIATNVWALQGGFLNGSGTEATPFS